jgi:hypothetical protein
MRFIDCAVFCFGRGGFYASSFARSAVTKGFFSKQNLRQLCRCDLAANRTGKCERTRDRAVKNGTALVPAGA